MKRVITPVALGEAGKGAWYCEHGVFAEKAKWHLNATTVLAEPEEVPTRLRSCGQVRRQEKMRNKDA